jgi:hypothetical protein
MQCALCCGVKVSNCACCDVKVFNSAVCSEIKVLSCAFTCSVQGSVLCCDVTVPNCAFAVLKYLTVHCVFMLN